MMVEIGFMFKTKIDWEKKGFKTPQEMIFSNKKRGGGYVLIVKKVRGKGEIL